MSRGLIGLLQLAGSVVFGIPVAIFGLLKLGEGDLLVGAGFLLLAVLMVIGQEIYTSPTDVPAMVAERVAGRVVESPEDDQRER